MKFLPMSFFVLGTVLYLGAAACASYMENKFAVMPEELIFQPVPTVITAARYEQPLTEAPSTMAIITEEDIKLSGATTVQELFRSLPGMDILIASAANIDFAPRGLNGLMPNGILVMVDDHSVYEDFYGCTFWEFLPLTLEDIKRIEVIRGPGSALYGANAFSGVINIITKPPEDINGSVLSAAYGEQATETGSFVTAKTSGNQSYKLSLGYDGGGSWKYPARTIKNVSKASLTWQSKPEENRRITLSASLANGNTNFVALRVLTPQIDTLDYNGTYRYLQLSYDEPGFFLKTHLNSRRIKMEKVFGMGGEFNVAPDTFDTQVQRSLKWGGVNTFILGGNVRLNGVDSDALDARHEQVLWAAYLQNEFRIGEKLIFTLGERYDYHPLVKEHFSPRGSVVYKLAPYQLIRFSAATAFRNPSFMESYFKGTTAFLPGYDIAFSGNTALRSESLTTYEMGYQMLLFNKAAARLDFFYENFTDEIDYLVLDYFPPPYSAIPSKVTITNQGGATIRGGELSLDFPLTSQLSTTGNYSYQYATNNATGERNKGVPMHKANLGIKYQPERAFCQLSAHYQSEMEKEGGARALGKIEPYILVNLNLGYGFSDNARLTLSAFNLLNNKHREYPTAEEIGRKVTLGLRCTF